MSNSKFYEDKIRKLMAVANSPGANANEAASAAAMAAEMALAHSIDIGLIREVEGETPAKVFQEGPRVMGISAGDRSALLAMAGPVASLYGCSVLIHSLMYMRNPAHVADIFFVGQPHNVELSGTWIKYLWASCERSNKEAPEFRGIKRTYKMDRSFRLAFGNAVSQRLYEKLAAMKSQGIKTEASTSTALVVSNWFETERREVAKWMAANMRLGKVSKMNKRDLDYDAMLAGREAGKRVGLNDQIGNRSTSAGAITHDRRGS